MSDPHLDFEVRRYKAIREALLKDNADDIDEQTLADTTEGLTDLHELIAAIVRGADEDMAAMAALSDRIEKLKERRERLDRRCWHRRQVALDAMLECNIKTIRAPDFTASTRQGVPHVTVTDELKIPERFFKTVKVLLKQELRNELKNGAQIDGAELSNPGIVLSVRT